MSAYYTFLPHLRQGLTDVITVPDTYAGGASGLNERVNVAMNVTLQQTSLGGAVTPVTVTQQVMLKGPGDIIGISKNEVIKVFPTDWATNFEPNYLPYIEFYDEDFPWRYTPAKAKLEANNGNRYRLRPWISLVVLKDTEFENRDFNGILPSIKVTAPPNVGALHDERHTWAWAHVHLNDDLGTSSNDPGTGNIIPADINAAIASLNTKLKKEPDSALSRIICPRRLEANTSYYAFLVPTFEVGRKAGLGIPIPNPSDPLEPAWQSGTVQGTQKEFPVYYQWFFKTGIAGDFESLVRMLKPMALGNQIGKRAVDLQLPGNPLLDLTSPLITIGLQGALHPAGQSPDNWPVSNTFSTQLKTIVNAPALAQGGSPDPVIGAPIYGKWHAQVNSISGNLNPSTTDWINKVNLDPRLRIYAGIGAEVIRKNQDKYMSIAWEQIGDVIEANRKLRLLQLSMQANIAIQDKHIKPLSEEVLLNISAPVHTKVKASPLQTVYKAVEDSAIPNAMLSGAFRRITNPGSAFSKGMSNNGINIDTQSLIQDVNNGVAVIAGPYAAPSGMAAYNILSAAQMTPAYTASLPTIANFAFTAPGAFYAAPAYGPQSPAASALISAVMPLNSTIVNLAPYTYTTSQSLNLNTTVSTINTSIDPTSALLDLAQKQIKYVDPDYPISTPIPAIDTVLAAPRIDLPMYKELVAMSTEWLMPGLSTIADNSISLLEMDQAYIEAYMLGLNYEMGRELLWRGYPTDQRGTCFTFFWDFTKSINSVPLTAAALDPFRDIYPIHKWRASRLYYGPLTKLGTNSPRLDSLGTVSMIILTIRGELFRRYPGVRIYMQKAQWQYSNPPAPQIPQPLPSQPRKPDTSAPQLKSVFSAELYPDTYFLGFPLTVAQAKGSTTQGSLDPGYFFVFEEQSGELKFGADEVLPAVSYTNVIPGPTWNDLNWGNIKSNPQYKGSINPEYILTLTTTPANTYPDKVEWGRNSAGMAYSLLQFPVRLNIHANGLIS